MAPGVSPANAVANSAPPTTTVMGVVATFSPFCGFTAPNPVAYITIAAPRNAGLVGVFNELS